MVDSEDTGSHQDVTIYWNPTDTPVVGETGVVKGYVVTGSSVATYAYLYFNNALVGNSVPPDFCCSGYIWESGSSGASFQVTVTVKKGTSDCS